MSEAAVEILYRVTTSLETPVVFALLLALAWALVEGGWFLREWVDRRRAAPVWRAAGRALADHPAPAAALRAVLADRAEPDLLRPLPAVFRAGPPAAGPRDLDGLLHDMELRAARRLARVRIGLRLGPVLGLMGTLIPMGPALLGVAEGDLATMSERLIIAFSTTVAGLFVGAVCYVLLTARRYWYARDLAEVERLIDFGAGAVAPGDEAAAARTAAAGEGAR